LWAQAVQMIANSPALGIGVGGYEYVAPTLPPFSAERPMGDVPNAHNLWLQIGLDTGIVGLLAFVALWVVPAVGVFQAYRARRLRDLAIGVLAAMVVMAVQEWGESAYWGFKASFLMWYVLGLAVLFDKSSIEL
jgi:O-antigen ligase